MSVSQQFHLSTIGHVASRHYWDNYPGALSLSQATTIHLKIGHPYMWVWSTVKNFIDELFINDLFMLSQENDALRLQYQYINMCIDFFISHLSDIIDKHAPMKYKKIRQNNVPYMNSELRNYQRNMLKNIKNKHPCPENFERYRILRNKCVKAKLKSQRQYFAERCDGAPKNQHFGQLSNLLLVLNTILKKT